MDWEKIKGIFIRLLIVLNIALFGANLLISENYKLSASEEEAIFKVMADNGIGIDTEIIKKTPPMRSLGVSVVTLDEAYYKSLAFEEDEVPKITPYFEQKVYASDTISLIFQHNNVVYLKPEGTGELSVFNKENALEVANEFLAKVDDNQSESLKLVNVKVDDDAFVFEYNVQYKDYNLFSNKKQITVTAKGVTVASASFFKVDSFVGEKQSIVSCDEALLTLVEEVKKEDGEEKKYINKIELGYGFQGYDDIADGSKIRFVPCYRFFTSDQKSYVVNAYTNEMM